MDVDMPGEVTDEQIVEAPVGTSAEMVPSSHQFAALGVLNNSSDDAPELAPAGTSAETVPSSHQCVALGVLNNPSDDAPEPAPFGTSAETILPSPGQHNRIHKPVDEQKVVIKPREELTLYSDIPVGSQVWTGFPVMKHHSITLADDLVLSNTFNKKVDPVENVVPVFIEDLIDCKTHTLIISNMPVFIASFIARLISINVEECNAPIYTFEDGTGMIEVIDLLSVGSVAKLHSLNKFYRVRGKLILQAGPNQVRLVHIRPVASMDDLDIHSLEVTYTRLMLASTHHVESA